MRRMQSTAPAQLLLAVVCVACGTTDNTEVLSTGGTAPGSAAGAGGAALVSAGSAGMATGGTSGGSNSESGGGGSSSGTTSEVGGAAGAAGANASAGSGMAGSGGASGGASSGNVVSLFDGSTLSGWLPSSGTGVGNRTDLWDVKDDALHCTGTVRGTLISPKDYGNFRLIFDVRQLPSTGSDNHYASVLVWGARPPPNDAVGGLQFGVPNGYHWDYRPGHNDAGAKYFVATSGGFSRTEWARCEILAQMSSGVARMACCNLGTAATCKAKEVLKFTDAVAGKAGPIALQAHSAGSHDEYKNITVEENPPVDQLITTL
jgi:Domain of Unknown Function (DUF1080)